MASPLSVSPALIAHKCNELVRLHNTHAQHLQHVLDEQAKIRTMFIQYPEQRLLRDAKLKARQSLIDKLQHNVDTIALAWHTNQCSGFA